MFLALEGIDGSGKTTVAKLLAERVPGCLQLRTPGHAFPQVRDLVLNPTYSLDDNARLLFFLGEMVDLNTRVIATNRDSRLVLTDRFFLSTFVYQVWMRYEQLSSAEFVTFLKIFKALLPDTDATVILSTDAETALKRAKGHDVEFSEKDHFEAAGIEAWKRRKTIYDTSEDCAIAGKLGKIIRIDTTHITPVEVVEEIMETLNL